MASAHPSSRLAARSKQARPSLELLLDREQDAFDDLLREVRAGIRGGSHYDELESRADALATNIRRAFRSRDRS